MTSTALRTVGVARRPRDFVRVAGRDAASFLEAMVSNEVASLAAGEARDALLLTAKARVIAPLRVLRRAEDDFLLLTEPELGEVVERQLLRMRFAAKVEVEREEHDSFVVVGESRGGIPIRDYGVPAAEVIDGDVPADLAELTDVELERLRIAAGTPAFGKEIDDRVLPAEAGLTETYVSFTKGCYPGQEPIARQHYRGRVNRRLRVLDVESGALLQPEGEIRFGEKAVGRVTSAVPGLALGYVRSEVPDGADVDVGTEHAKVRPA